MTKKEGSFTKKMKYSKAKKIVYSIVILAMIIGFTLISVFGIDENGSGSAKDINLGLDLAGGVSITYEIQEDNPQQSGYQRYNLQSLKNVWRVRVQNHRFTKQATRE